MENLNLSQVAEWLIKEGYIAQIKGKYKLTGKFEREYIPSTTLVTVKRELAVSNIQLSPEELFMQFIKAAEVPTKTANGRGGFYWINRFNKDAAREFHRMLTKENINLQILVASTKLYYLQTKECANTIANYIVLGVWRSGYNDMMMSAERGTLEQDIKKELQGDSFTKDI